MPVWNAVTGTSTPIFGIPGGSVSEDEERADYNLKVAIMQADLNLKKQQSIWETPRNIAILVTSVAAIAGFLGFKIGQKDTPPSPPPQVIFQPGSIQVTPAAPEK
jgi:hypothetical protein